MARRARTSRNRKNSAIGVPASPHIKRAFPFFEALNEEQIEKLEAQVDWLIQDVGIAFRDDPEAIALWKREG
ncbi:trimethylamine methyltransferase family protein, partial [Paracoccaceae bacterium]|nr:trimethylamine methyltransferase family protein [Paracoccaceae bacterium]